MAENKFTHIATSASVTQVAPTRDLDQGVENEMVVSIRPLGLDFWEYEGTRAQLEAEGLIPAETKWPEGAQDRYWQVGRFRYQLSRTRRKGLKGPMKVWTSGDWWSLRCDLVDGPSLMMLQIEDKRKELAAALHHHSPAGRREFAERFTRYLKARDDTAFQAFKSQFVPERKKPGRGPKAGN